MYIDNFFYNFTQGQQYIWDKKILFTDFPKNNVDKKQDWVARMAEMKCLKKQ